MSQTYYDVLGIDIDATPAEIKTAYRNMIKAFHPDLYPGDKQFAEKQSKKVNEAYEVLGNPERRREYDKILREKEEQQYQEHQEYQEYKRQQEYQQQNSEDLNQKRQQEENQEHQESSKQSNNEGSQTNHSTGQKTSESFRGKKRTFSTFPKVIWLAVVIVLVSGIIHISRNAFQDISNTEHLKQKVINFDTTLRRNIDYSATDLGSDIGLLYLPDTKKQWDYQNGQVKCKVDNNTIISYEVVKEGEISGDITKYSTIQKIKHNLLSYYHEDNSSFIEQGLVTLDDHSGCYVCFKNQFTGGYSVNEAYFVKLQDGNILHITVMFVSKNLGDRPTDDHAHAEELLSGLDLKN